MIAVKELLPQGFFYNFSKMTFYWMISNHIQACILQPVICTTLLHVQRSMAYVVTACWIMLQSKRHACAMCCLKMIVIDFELNLKIG